MVSLRTVFRILLEGTGEFIIIASALVLTSQYGKTGSFFPPWRVIFFFLLGILLRIYADEIYLTTRDGNWCKRIFHLEK